MVRRHSAIERPRGISLTTAVGYEFTFDGNITFFIDHFLTCKDIVSFGYRLVDISNKGVGDSLNTALIFRSIEPSPVGEFGIS